MRRWEPCRGTREHHKMWDETVSPQATQHPVHPGTSSPATRGLNNTGLALERPTCARGNAPQMANHLLARATYPYTQEDLAHVNDRAVVRLRCINDA